MMNIKDCTKNKKCLCADNLRRLTIKIPISFQDEINKESGMDPEDGGVDVPDSTDGVTRYPQVDGAPIDPDDPAGTGNGNGDY